MWAVSRSVGVPLGPDGGLPERLGLLDGAATTLEALVLAGTFALLWSHIGERVIARAAARLWKAAAMSGITIATTAVLLAAAGRTETLARAGGVAVSAAHVVHFALLGGALLAFAGYVVVSVGRRTHRTRLAG